MNNEIEVIVTSDQEEYALCLEFVSRVFTNPRPLEWISGYELTEIYLQDEVFVLIYRRLS